MNVANQQTSTIMSCTREKGRGAIDLSTDKIAIYPCLAVGGRGGGGDVTRVNV